MHPDGASSPDRVVVVTHVFHPDSQITGALLSNLCVRLATQGFRIGVLAGFPAEERECLEGAAPRREIWNGVEIRRGGAIGCPKASMVRRLWSYLHFLFWLSGQLLVAVPRETRVLVVTNPPFAPIVVALCGLVRGWKFDVLLHDVYPEGLVATGVLKSPVAIRIWSAANRFALGRAGRVITLGRDMADMVDRNYRVGPKRLAVVPNWSPHVQGDQTAAELTFLWRRLQIPKGRFVVQYSGNMGLWHDLESVVRAAHALRDLREVVFLLIGDGRRKASAAALAAELGCHNIQWLPFQPADTLTDSLSCCHVALISQREGLEGVAVPSKLYGILASGRAVLAQVPASSEAAMVIREEECGWVIPPGDSDGLAACIRRIYRSEETWLSAGRRARAAYESKYTPEAAVASYVQILRGREIGDRTKRP